MPNQNKYTTETGSKTPLTAPTSLPGSRTVSHGKDIFRFIPQSEGYCDCEFVGPHDPQGYHLVVPNQSPTGEYVVNFWLKPYLALSSYEGPYVLSCDMSACTHIKSIMFEGFSHTRIKEVILPPNIEMIDKRAFAGCSDLVKCDLSKCSHLVRIHEWAFEDCSLLSAIELPKQVAFVKDYAFRHCVSATTITLNEGLQSIGCEAFASCNSVTSLRIPRSVHTIGGYAFKECAKLQTVYIPEHMDESKESMNNPDNESLIYRWGLDDKKTKIKVYGRGLFSRVFHFLRRLDDKFL